MSVGKVSLCVAAVCVVSQSSVMKHKASLFGDRYRNCIAIDRFDIRALASIARFFPSILGVVGEYIGGGV